MRGSEQVGMNLVVIEEHQVGDLVLTRVYYLYILLEATLAYVIVPITKVSQCFAMAYVIDTPSQHQNLISLIFQLMSANA